VAVAVNPMTSLRDVIADALLTELAGETPTWVRIEGRVDGPSPDRPILCTWPMERLPVDGFVLEETLRVGVRLYPLWKQQVVPDLPRNPERLEDLAERALTTLEAEQINPGDDNWDLKVEGTLFDQEGQGVQLTVAARRWNSFGCP
jgi:hypothetical protein